MPPAPTTAAGEEGEEVPPAKRNREEKEPEVDEARVARLAYALFGTPTDSEPETEPPESSFPPPSPSSSTSDDDEDFTAEGLRARDAALSVCKSVVSLAASIDEDPQSTLACTGTVVAHRGPATWIMTSAALIRKCESDTEVHETSIVKIEVLLPNKKVASGQVLMYDLQYNIAIVSIECQADLPVVAFTDLPVSYFLTPGPVVAIARKFESGRLRVKRGETFRTVSKLDCDELMVSTCQIEQVRVKNDNI
uniref:Uncharacterized protein n=1 Tax=Avena sativa TaxID=4498 RepID=A0ACD5Y238_AVESA